MITRAISAELFGVRRRRSLQLVALVWILQIVLFAYIANYAVAQFVTDLGGQEREAIARSLRLDQAASSVVGSLPIYGGPVMLMIGALVGGGDDRVGLRRTVLARFADRRGHLLGKVVTLVIVTGLLMAASVVIASVCSLIVCTMGNLPLGGFDALATLQGFCASWLIAFTWATFGLGLVVVTRSLLSTALIGLMWGMLVEQGIHALAGSLTVLAPVRGVLLTGASGALAAWVGVPTGAPTAPPDMAGPVAVASLLGWIIVWLVAAFTAVSVRDVE